MINLDELAVQVGREAAAGNDHCYYDYIYAFGARAMLAKLRELGLVVEWRPLHEPPKSDETVLCANDEAADFIEVTYWNVDGWSCHDRRYARPFVAFTHFAKLPKGPGHD